MLRRWTSLRDLFMIPSVNTPMRLFESPPMNYFCHALNHLDRPYFMAGTAVPDWLSVADRRVRFRPQHLSPFADSGGTVLSEVAAGTLQHLQDDDWFHATRGFFEVTTEIAGLFRTALGHEGDFHYGFLGHVGMEMLLDAVLIERFPGHFDRYYQALADVDPTAIQDSINQMARVPTDRLAWFIGLFRVEQFLRDYVSDERLLHRLNQVMSRVKLTQLPPRAIGVLEESRSLVRGRIRDLLPEEFYPFPSESSLHRSA